MKTVRLTQITRGVGENNLGRTLPSATRAQRWLILGLILFFFLVSITADLWPVKKPTSFPKTAFCALSRHSLSITLAMRYSDGRVRIPDQSLTYLALAKLTQRRYPRNKITLPL